MPKVTELANGRARVQTRTLRVHYDTLRLGKAPRLWLTGMWRTKKGENWGSVGALEEALPEQGQPAASIEGTDTAVSEQSPELGTNERVMSWRGQDSGVWQAWDKVSIGRGLSPGAAGLSQWH